MLTVVSFIPIQLELLISPAILLLYDMYCSAVVFKVTTFSGSFFIVIVKIKLCNVGGKEKFANHQLMISTVALNKHLFQQLFNSENGCVFVCHLQYKLLSTICLCMYMCVRILFTLIFKRKI